MGKTFPGHSFCLYHRADLLAGVTGIPFIEKVPQRGEIIVALLAVYPVVDSNEVYILLRKQHFRVHSNLKVITAEAGHIFYDNHIDISGFNIG